MLFFGGGLVLCDVGHFCYLYFLENNNRAQIIVFED